MCNRWYGVNSVISLFVTDAQTNYIYVCQLCLYYYVIYYYLINYYVLNIFYYIICICQLMILNFKFISYG